MQSRPPIAVGKGQAVEQAVIGIDAAALAHRHVMGRIKTARADISPRPRKAGLPVDGVLRAERVAIVLDQPEVVLFAKLARTWFSGSKGLRAYARS